MTLDKGERKERKKAFKKKKKKKKKNKSKESSWFDIQLKLPCSFCLRLNVNRLCWSRVAFGSSSSNREQVFSRSHEGFFFSNWREELRILRLGHSHSQVKGDSYMNNCLLFCLLEGKKAFKHWLVKEVNIWTSTWLLRCAEGGKAKEGRYQEMPKGFFKCSASRATIQSQGSERKREEASHSMPGCFPKNLNLCKNLWHDRE